MKMLEEPDCSLASWCRGVARRGAVAGALASLLSTTTIAARSKADGDSLFCGTNATSHWIWGERAYHRQECSLRYTLIGYLIHHTCSVFWATLFMAWRQRPALIRPTATATGQVTSPPTRCDCGGKRAHSRRQDAAGAAAMAVLAAAVDYTATPHRLRPGYERHLHLRSLVGVYAAFGVGLFIATRCLGQTRR